MKNLFNEIRSQFYAWFFVLIGEAKPIAKGTYLFNGEEWIITLVKNGLFTYHITAEKKV